jgi:thioesterase domain-containing protein
MIRREFGVSLPVRALIESPTLEGLARIIDATAPDSGLLTVVQPYGSRAPIFAIHDGGGYYFYWALAMRVAQDRPFYAIQAETHLHGWTRPFGTRRTVEELATRYIREIEAMEPDGPYHLTGASFGGLVAFEIARQLRAKGRCVASLTLLSTLLRDPELQRGPSANGDGLYRRMRRRASECVDGANWWWRGFRKPPIQPTLIHQRYIRRARDLAARYRPGAYDGHAILFRAASDSLPRWDHLFARGLRMHEMPGRHMDMLHPKTVDGVATLMRGYIDDTEAALSPGPVVTAANRVGVDAGTRRRPARTTGLRPPAKNCDEPRLVQLRPAGSA